MSTVDLKNNIEKEQSIEISIVRYHMRVLTTKYQQRIKVILTSKETDLLLRALLYIFCLSINCLVFIFEYIFCSLE